MPKVYGIEHILYIVITTAVAVAGLLLAKKFCKTEKSQTIFIKCLAGLLFISIVTNRLSQVFSWGGKPHWKSLIPDSFCGMTSLVLSLSVLLGKKDNIGLHFAWLLGIFGGIATVAYADFIGQSDSVFFLPTISGLLHHSFSATLVVALFLFKQINLTYKKWYAPVFGLTAYIALGAFLMSVLGKGDAFHIVEPLLSGTPLTAWVMAPIYFTAHALILLAVELYRKFSPKLKAKTSN